MSHTNVLFQTKKVHLVLFYRFYWLRVLFCIQLKLNRMRFIYESVLVICGSITFLFTKQSVFRLNKTYLDHNFSKGYIRRESDMI